ncbi:glutathione transferase GstA [Methylomagnum sp.]
MPKLTLYYAPGACSLAAHIALREAGFEFDLAEVDLATHQTADGKDFAAINPKGYVPALQLGEGQVLTEAQVVLQYLADQKPDSGLAPPFGGMERYRLMETLAFIATEIHKGFGPLWNPKTPEAARENALALLSRRFDYVAHVLEGRMWLMGHRFTVADAYLFTVLNWTGVHKIDLSRWPRLAEYQSRVAERPAVQAALKAEKLV